MNFYKHHLGDYAAATSHLTWDEDCAYRRLIDQYYKREAPLPVDVKDCCRLARATSASQRRSVTQILSEFFVLEFDGWHQKRCDIEIESANAQAATNKRIAEEREARRRDRDANDSLHDKSTNRSPGTGGEREPSQTPDSRLQTPDSIEENPPASRVPPVASPRPTKKCPSGFTLSDELRSWAKAKAPGVNVDRETEAFRDHTFGTARSDWDGTWRNWIRKASTQSRPNGRSGPDEIFGEAL